MSHGLCLTVPECAAQKPVKLPVIKPLMIAKATRILFSLDEDGNTLMISIIV